MVLAVPETSKIDVFIGVAEWLVYWIDSLSLILAYFLQLSKSTSGYDSAKSY